MPKIHQLSQSIINKIAAGEVIERPASVVKELMENAVDAGSTRIDVSVEAGGSDLVRVVDNGCGITADDLPLAVASHATSKITTADDLFRVHTLGFRGEALASIAEISRMTIRSRTPDDAGGSELTINGGEPSPIVPCAGPVGTTIEVRNLFFNTPVRRKFLRSTQTELGHVSEAFTRIALAASHIHFTLRHNDRVVFELPGSQTWLDRIGMILGRELTEGMFWVESVDGPVRLSGYAAHPAQSRSNNRMQYLFLNGRCIRDRSLQHALSEAYRGLLTVGRFPIAVLSLEVPADWVDVNVHPTKLEVRFQDSGRLYGQLLAALRTKFLASDLTTQVRTPVEADPHAAHDEGQADRVRRDLVDWAKGQVDSWAAGPRSDEASRNEGFEPGSDGFGGRDRSWSDSPLEVTRIDRPRHPSDVGGRAGGGSFGGNYSGGYSSGGSFGVGRRAFDDAACDADGASATTGGFSRPEDDAAASGGEFAEFASYAGGHAAPHRVPFGGLNDERPQHVMQIHNRYLVAESDDGMVVIDQHALHERILYEQLRRRVTSGGVESQQLLVPEAVDLPPAEAAAALEHRELLAQLGMKIEPFGGDTILIASYPAMLSASRPAEVLQEILDRLMAGGKMPEHRDLLDDLLHTVACKAAIKAGDRLTHEEIVSLLQQRHLVDDPHHCPHGRPTALVFSRDELDKHFRRI